MTAAATHLPSGLTIAVAVALTVWIAWYWTRLGAHDVPGSRRRIRRASLVVMFATLPIAVQGLSFVDHEARPAQYVTTWMMLVVLLGLLLLTAVVDTFNTLRLARRSRDAAMVDAMRPRR